MPTDKHQLSVALPQDDYEWLSREAERAGISKSGVLRQALSLYQATGGLLGPVRLEMSEQVYAAAHDHEVSKEKDDTDASACRLNSSERSRK